MTKQQNNGFSFLFLFQILWSFNFFSSVQFSCSVVSDFLWPYGVQHSRPPCPLTTPGAYSNSRPLSQLCHPTISSSVIPFSSCFQSFSASGSFPVHQFISCGQSIGASASASVFSVNSQLISFRIDWYDLLALQGILKSSPMA